MTIHHKNKCIFDALEGGEIDLLVHQVNCQKAMGSGIAGEIRRRYPRHYDDYMKQTPILGKVFITPIELDFAKSGIAGVFGQFNYGSGKRHTNYAALLKGIDTILARCSILKSVHTIGIPYGIGCGLGGGEWDIVEKMLTDLSELYSDRIVIYKKD